MKRCIVHDRVYGSESQKPLQDDAMARYGRLVLQVVETEQYQQWMAGFGSTVKHVHVNSRAVPETYPLPSPATLQVSPKSELNPSPLPAFGPKVLRVLHGNIVVAAC